jgi:DNA polymerase III epsilon subunit-like protein
MRATTVYFDLETGGLKSCHPNIQIAAVAIDDETREELGAFECKIQFNPAEADPEALAMNHYTPEAWASAIPAKEAAVRFGRFLKPYCYIGKTSEKGNSYSVAKLCGHNAATFDGPRLRTMFFSNDVFLAADLRIRCTVQRALFWFDEHAVLVPDNMKLETLCRYFGVHVDVTHDALADVRLNARLANAIATYKGGSNAPANAG